MHISVVTKGVNLIQNFEELEIKRDKNTTRDIT